MTDLLQEAEEYGFSADEINAEAMRLTRDARWAGYSDKEIEEEYGFTIQPLTTRAIARPDLPKITPVQESGYSPVLQIGGRTGRINFDVPAQDDEHTPGLRYLFEDDKGGASFYQLEDDYQGGRWEQSEHAENDYNEYLNIPPNTRREMLHDMWQGSPVGEMLYVSTVAGESWQEAQSRLSQFDTYRQISTVDGEEEKTVDELTAKISGYIEDAEVQKVLDFMVASGMAAQAGEDTADLAIKYGINPNIVAEELTWATILNDGVSLSTLGLLNELRKVLNGDPDAAKDAAEILLRMQALESQPWYKRIVGNITSITADLPILVPFMAGGSSACSGFVGVPYVGQAIPPACGMAAGFAVNSTLKTAFMTALEAEVVENEVEFVDLMLYALQQGGVEGFIGFMTGGVGGMTRVAMMKRGITNKYAVGTGTLFTETSTLTGLSSAIHKGTLPSVEDFAQTATELLILRGGAKGYQKTKRAISRKVRGTEWYVARNLREMYKKMGIDPRQVREDIKNNPRLAQQLLETLSQEKFMMPDFYAMKAAELMGNIELAQVVSIDVGGKTYRVSRVVEENGSLTVTAKPEDADPTRVHLEIGKDGNYEVAEILGQKDPHALDVITRYAETLDRRVNPSEKYPEVEEARTEKETEVSPMMEQEAIIAKTLMEAKREAGEFRKRGEEDAAVEIETTARELAESVVGKEEVVRIEAKAERVEAEIIAETKRQASQAEYKATGFHPPEDVAETVYGRIERLELPRHDAETEVVVSHATDRVFDAFSAREAGGFVHFGSDAQAGGRAAGMKNPIIVRTQIKYNRPLDLRNDPLADEATNGFRDGTAVAQYLLRKGRFTEQDVERVRDSSERLAEVSKILAEKGYDAILYKNTVEGAKNEDAVAILKDENMRILGYADGKQADYQFQRQPPAHVVPGGNASDGGLNMTLIEGSSHAHRIMSLPALVELSRLLMDGKLPSVHKGLGEGTRGKFRSKEEMEGSEEIRLWAEIFKDPEQARKTLAHEIGHLVDWLEGSKDYTLKRGNILGRIAALSKYLKTYIEGRPGGMKPLTEKEKVKLRRQAEKSLKKEIEELAGDKKVQEELGITPQEIKDIFTGVLGRAEADPAIYEFIAGTGRQQKREILRTLAKGEIPQEIQAIIRRGEEAQQPETVTKEQIKARYQELFMAEARRRGLLGRDEVTEELKLVTKVWRPFDPEANPKYTAYRHNPKELYADFISAFLTNPQWLKRTAPKAYEGFMNYLESKPKFKKAYEKIQDELSIGGIKKTLRMRIRQGFEEGEEKFQESTHKTADLWGTDATMRSLVDKYWYVIRDVKRFGESNIADKDNPIYKIEEWTYQGTEAEGYMNDVSNRVVLRMERQGVTVKDFGEYLLHRRVVNERGELANPYGLTPKESMEIMREMERKYPGLSDIANDYWRIRKEWLVDRLDESGMYPETLMQKVRDNDAYSRFDVNEWAEQHYGPGMSRQIMGQVGTVKDIANPFTRTLVNDMMLMRSVNRNTAIDATIKFYEKASASDPDLYVFQHANRRWTGSRHEFAEPTDPHQKLIVVTREGKAHGYYLDRYVVEAFERNPQEDFWIARTLNTLNVPFRKVFTELNYGFWMFNAFRDYKRTVRNLPAEGPEKVIPYIQFLEYFKYWRQGLKPAFKSVYGIPDSVIKQMYKNNELISIEERWGDNPKDTEMERLLKRHHQIPSKWDSEIMRPFRQLSLHWHNIGQALERQNKVASHIYLKEKFPDLTPEERGHMIRVQAGSPAFLRRGADATTYNNLFMFSNAIKEGWRGDYEVFKDRPGQFMYKTAQNNLLPKALMYAMAIGMLGEDNKTIMDGVSEYDKTNYIIIPVGLTEDGRSVYIRIPQDETGRFFGGVFWKTLNADKDTDITDLADYTAGQFPGLSPSLTTAWGVTDYLSGQNPYDFFRERSAIDSRVWDAGFPDREIAFSKWLSNKLGGGIVYRFNTEEIERISSGNYADIEKIINFPVLQNALGRFVKISDYGVRETLQEGSQRAKEHSAKMSITVNEALNQMALDPNYQLSREEVMALAEKSDGLDKRGLRILTKMYGNAFVQTWLSASSNLERAEILREVIKLAEGGNITAREFLGYTQQE